MLRSNNLTAILVIQQIFFGQSLAGLLLETSRFPVLQQKVNPLLAPSVNNTGHQLELLGADPGNVFDLGDKWNPFKHFTDQGTHQFPSGLVAKKNPVFEFFNSAPRLDWLILLIEIGILSCFDVIVIQSFPNTTKFYVGAVLLWILMALFCNVTIFFRFEIIDASEWCAGYILEWALSFENIFVFQLVFKCFHTPEVALQKAVFMGIIGAALLRFGSYLAVSALMSCFHWIRWPFSLLLIYSGYQVATEEEEDDTDIKDLMWPKFFKGCLGSRLALQYDGDNCLTRDSSGRLQATLLPIVIFCLGITDVLFAVDSVSAKTANIENMYIAFSSSVIAMFGLRSMFFVIKDLSSMFHLMKYGLAIILVFVGIQLALMDAIHIRTTTVCILIVGVLIVRIAADSVKTMMPKHATPPAAHSLINNPSEAAPTPNGWA